MTESAAKPKRAKKSPGPGRSRDAGQLAFWQDDVTPEHAAATGKGGKPGPAGEPSQSLFPADPAASALVGKEILTKRYDPGAWAMALATAGRKSGAAEAEYARLRLLALQSEMASSRRKELALEERRLAMFRKIPQVDPVDRRENQRRRHPLPVLPLIALWLGTSAVLAMIWRFSGAVSNKTPVGSDMAAHLALGASFAAAVWLLHSISPGSRRVIRRWVPIAAMIISSVSLCGAVRVITEANPAMVSGRKVPARFAPVDHPPAAAEENMASANEHP